MEIVIADYETAVSQLRLQIADQNQTIQQFRTKVQQVLNRSLLIYF
jgi:flagellar biosynthesis chaperone FliJ